MFRFFLWVTLLIVVMLLVPAYLEACPACKTLDDPIGKGFNFSILFMIAMPFAVFGLIGGTIFLQWNGYRISALWLSARTAIHRRFSTISKQEH